MEKSVFILRYNTYSFDGDGSIILGIFETYDDAETAQLAAMDERYTENVYGIGLKGELKYPIRNETNEFDTTANFYIKEVILNKFYNSGI